MLHFCHVFAIWQINLRVFLWDWREYDKMLAIYFRHLRKLGTRIFTDFFRFCRISTLCIPRWTHFLLNGSQKLFMKQRTKDYLVKIRSILSISNSKALFFGTTILTARYTTYQERWDRESDLSVDVNFMKSRMRLMNTRKYLSTDKSKIHYNYCTF